MSEQGLGEYATELLQAYFLDVGDESQISGLYKTVMNQVEKALIESVLAHNKHNKVKTAKMLGINRNTLHKKISDYQLEKK